MKRFYFIVAFIFAIIISGTSYSQKAYCEIVGTEGLMTKKVSITIDYGQEQKLFGDYRLKDENGKVKKFNSMVDALNYMGSMGWSFEQAYVITHGNVNVYHWLLSMPIAVENSAEVEPYVKHEKGGAYGKDCVVTPKSKED